MDYMRTSLIEKALLLIIIVLTVTAVYIGSWTARNGEITFNADIARDFLLFDSLDSDPIMLIGPRADYKGLFHGPAWLYVNYPAYLIGQGNPVAISWYWILLTLAVAALNYWIGMKLFDKLTGIVFAALFTVSTMHYINQFYNPTGAMFIAPLFIYCAYMYVKTHKLPWMLGQLFLAGMMLQFQLAAGIPTILLSGLAVLYLIIKHKNYKHIFGFFILLVPLSSFLLFELKFGFSQFKGVVNHFNGSVAYYSLSFKEKLADRYGRLFGPGLGFFAGKYGGFNQYIAVIIAGAIGYALKLKKQKDMRIYWVTLYYFLGFYILSFIHNGSVLLHYYLPFMFMPVLLFASLHRFIDRRLFLGIVAIIFVINISHLSDEQKEYASKKGTHFTSWTSLQTVLAPVKNETEKEVGIFVYAPDAYAYAPKYGALYTKRMASFTDVRINEKKDVTYLLYEPIPKDFPWLNGSSWKTDLLDIDTKPVESTTYPSGYRLEKYLLTKEQQALPIDPLALDWISQR
jgi:hypothetical protein